MNFYKVREELLTGNSILNLPLRVTFYARVSTDKDEQINSLENQVYYYQNYIMSNSNWTYVEGYIDEGLSGTTTHKRKNFLKMIEAATEQSFDLILTKELSRFSRNLLDSIKYTEILKQHNVGVFFQTNGITTYDPNSEFILNMLGSLAQEEVKRLSTRVKWGHLNAIKRGRVLGNNSITGYVKDHAKLIIEPAEAKKVQEIFKLYATGKYGLNTLAIELYNRGMTNKNNKPYTKDTLKRIIENPKYKGYYRGHTTEVIDYKTKKRQLIKKDQQIIFKDATIPLIVTEELWDKANAILKKRSFTIKSKEKVFKKHSYTSKIYCEKHHCFYQRISNKYSQWACHKYIIYGNKGCQSPRLKEQDLNNIMSTILNNLSLNKETIVNSLLKLYTSFSKENSTVASKETLLKQQDNLLDLYLNSLITKEKYLEKKTHLQEQYLKITSKNNLDLITLKEKLQAYLDFDQHLSLYISKVLNKMIITEPPLSKTNVNIQIFLAMPITSYTKIYTTKKINISYTVY